MSCTTYAVSSAYIQHSIRSHKIFSLNVYYSPSYPGAIAGSVSAGCVTPMDVIKTRLQVVGGAERYPGGIRDAVATIYREEGAAAFSKGLLPRMMVQAPLFGITLLSYEVLKAFYRSRQQ